MNNSSSVAPSANSSSGVAPSIVGSTNSTPDHSTSATTGGELSSQQGEGVGTKSRNSHCIVYISTCVSDNSVTVYHLCRDGRGWVSSQQLWRVEVKPGLFCPWSNPDSVG